MAAAYIEGWRRALAAPHLVTALLGCILLGTLLTSPGADRDMPSEAASTLAQRAADEWTPRLPAGIADELLGLGGLLRPLGAIVMPAERRDALEPASVVVIALWIFVSGGIIDRLARGRRVGGDAFFATCGRHVLRLTRFTVLALAGYWALSAGPWVPAIGDAAGSSWRWVGWAALLAIYTLVADVARVRLVVEDRFSALAGWTAGWRFVRRRAGRLLALSLAHLAGVAALVVLWTHWGPDWTSGTVSPPAAALLYLTMRLWMGVAWVASAIAFFQGELAHATYVAAPLPEWPDSPSTEALRRLRAPRA